MDELNPKARSDPYGRRINRTASPLRAVIVPYATILLGSLLAWFPLTATIPLLPPLGYLMLLGWRIMRPGMLPMWAGAALGAVDDLFSGQPFGSAIFLWSLAMLGLEALEAKVPWRGFWQDWMTAGVAVVLYLLLAMLVSGAKPSMALLVALVPQILLSIMLYPIIARMVAWLDRLRLTRVKVLD